MFGRNPESTHGHLALRYFLRPGSFVLVSSEKDPIYKVLLRPDEYVREKELKALRSAIRSPHGCSRCFRLNKHHATSTKDGNICDNEYTALWRAMLLQHTRTRWSAGSSIRDL